MPKYGPRTSVSIITLGSVDGCNWNKNWRILLTHPGTCWKNAEWRYSDIGRQIEVIRGYIEYWIYWCRQMSRGLICDWVMNYATFDHIGIQFLTLMTWYWIWLESTGENLISRLQITGFRINVPYTQYIRRIAIHPFLFIQGCNRTNQACPDWKRNPCNPSISFQMLVRMYITPTIFVLCDIVSMLMKMWIFE